MGDGGWIRWLLAIMPHATGLILLVEYDDGVECTLGLEILDCGQPTSPGSDDGDLLDIKGCGRNRTHRKSAGLMKPSSSSVGRKDGKEEIDCCDMCGDALA